MVDPKKKTYYIQEGLKILRDKEIEEKYISNGHYITRSGSGYSGIEKFYWIDGIVINTSAYRNDWDIIAYHGTQWCNLNSILELGLLPGSPTECVVFNANIYGKGVYCSPYQDYAKEYAKGSTEELSFGEQVRLVLGLRIRDSSCILKTTDPKIWLIRDPRDVVVQDINLTFE